MESAISPDRKGSETSERKDPAQSNDGTVERIPVEGSVTNATIDDAECGASSMQVTAPDTSATPSEDIDSGKVTEETTDARNKQQESKSETFAPENPLTLVEQDLAVFGNLNLRLADAFTERIETAITQGVDSLPLLDGDCYRTGSKSSLPTSAKATIDSNDDDDDDNKSSKQRLWEALRYRYVRNVDVLEAYCGHHLLTLRKHPPARRKRIVGVMMGGVEALPQLEGKEEIAENRGKSEVEHTYPKPTELPTENEKKELVEELSRMKAELQAAKEKRNTLLALLESTARAQQAVADVVATVEANIPTLQEGKILAEVGEKVEKGNTIGLLAEETKSLVEKIDGIKRDRNKQKDTESDDAYEFVQRDDPLFRASNRAGNKRHKPLSLEEAYRRDRRQLGLLTDSTNDNGGTNISVSALKSMAMASSALRSPSFPLPAPRTPDH